MEEKKFDPYQFIGFVLIAIIMTWMLMNQQPVEEVAAEAVVTEEKTTTQEAQSLSEANQQLQANYGSFTDLVQPQAASVVSLENEVLSFEFSTKGGQMTKAYLKGYTNYLDQPLNLVDENQYINFSFTTLDGRTLNTADLNFTPELSTENDSTVLHLKAALNTGQWIAFRYALSKDDFMVDFSIRSEGMQRVINQNIPQTLQWELTALRNSRSIEYENRYTELTYGYEGEKVNELSISGDDEEEVEDVQWLGYKQHFFNSILVPTQSFDKVAIASESIDAEGWFKSGDAGYLREGFLFIHDRVKDMIISGGENIYPAEIENVLMSHAAISDAAVIGVPDDRWGETVKAIITPAATEDGKALTEEVVFSYCRKNLASYKCPTSVDWMETIPRNPSGKILKTELRKPYWAGRERNVS